MLAPKFSLGGGHAGGEENLHQPLSALSPSKGSCSSRTNELRVHTLARDDYSWQRRSGQRYDRYNFFVDEGPVCSQRLNEGSFA
jgi:hypothetical protein